MGKDRRTEIGEAEGVAEETACEEGQMTKEKKEKKEKKWGSIGAPGSKKRAEHLASIRAKKRKTGKQRDAEKEEAAKEDITLIESETVDLELGEKKTVTAPAAPKAKAVNTIIVEEQKKMEAPGEPGEPYVEYAY